MRQPFSSPWLEQRLIGLIGYSSSERQKQLDEAIDSVSTSTTRPVSATNLGQELDRLENWGSIEVSNVKPSIAKKMGRYTLGKSAALFGKEASVYDATTAEVANSIDRQAYQRMTIAEKALDDAQHNSLENIRTLSRQTKLSAGFLKHKAAVCDRLKTDLGKELSQSEDRLRVAKNIRSFDRSQLKRVVVELKEKLKAVNKIGGDTSKKLEGSMVGNMHHDIDSAVRYFTDTCGAYLPQNSGNVRAMIQAYVEGDKTELEGLMKELAEVMYPDDTNLQKAQLASMKRIAVKITGDQGVWRAMRRRFVEIAPTAVAGVGTGFLTGGIGWGLGAAALAGVSVVVLRAANNGIRYGTLNKSDFEKSQAASYFNSSALESVQKNRELKAEKNLTKKLKMIQELESGSKIKVNSSNGDVAELTLTSTVGNIRLATSTSGNRYSIDTKGGGTGAAKEFQVSIEKKGSSTKEHKKLVANVDPSSDCIFTITT